MLGRHGDLLRLDAGTDGILEVGEPEERARGEERKTEWWGGLEVGA